MPAQTVIKLRRDTAANWTSANPVLAAGEAGLETDSGLIKYGNGTSTWDLLPYGSTSAIRTRVLNQTGSSIAKGSVVYISGASGDNPQITLADADTEATSSKTLGLVDETIANGAIGYVVEAGLITGLNTATATAGQSVWLSSTAGGFVYGAPPAKPAHSVYLGVVIRAQTNNGAILVKVQNGYELEEIHNVNITGPLADNEVLAWDDASQMWINQTAAEAGLAALSGATFTGAINGTSLTLSGDLTVNGTTTNINTQNLVVEDKNVIIGDVATPSDTTADGGGITLKGATDKTLTWVDATDAWTSSEDFNLVSGKVYEINGTTVLSSSQVLGKSMPTGDVVGTSDSQALTNKTLSTGSNWQGNAVGAVYGGTGLTSYTTGDVIYSSASNTLAKLGIGSTGQVLTVSGGLPVWAAAPVSLPSQTGNAGEFLVTGGTNASWSNTVTANSASVPALIAKAATSQTANIQEWQSDTGTALVRINPSGSLLVGNGITLNNAGTVDVSFLRVGFGLTGMMLSVVAISATQIGAIIRGAASQTANLQEWQNSAGTVLASVSSAGNLSAPAIIPTGSTVPTNGMYLSAANTLDFATNSTKRVTISSAGEVGIGATPIATDMLYVNTTTAANTGVIVRGVASQSGNLTEWQNSGGTILARVDASGRFVGDGSQLTGIAAGESVSPLLLMGA